LLPGMCLLSSAPAQMQIDLRSVVECSTWCRGVQSEARGLWVGEALVA